MTTDNTVGSLWYTSKIKINVLQVLLVLIVFMRLFKGFQFIYKSINIFLLWYSLGYIESYCRPCKVVLKLSIKRGKYYKKQYYSISAWITVKSAYHIMWLSNNYYYYYYYLCNKSSWPQHFGFLPNYWFDYCLMTNKKIFQKSHGLGIQFFWIK